MKKDEGFVRYPCPCCGYLTFGEEPGGTYVICHVCFWEDDFVQFRDPDYRGGANKVSLKEARENFKVFGAVEPDKVQFVRPPKPEEKLN